MTSLWQLTSPAIASDTFDGRRHDVVVVGAGLTGLVVAVLLARAGKQVQVLEARAVGAVTTGNTTGKLSLLQGTTFSQLREHVDDDVLRAYAEGNRLGQAWLTRQLEAAGEPIERRTAFTYAPTPAAKQLLDDELEASHIAGIEIEESSASELPYQTFGALQLVEQVQLHPMRALAMLARELRRLGGSIVERCRVHDVEQQSRELRVLTSQGETQSDLCVLATGTPVLDRGMFFAKLKPSRSYVAAFAQPPGTAPKGMFVAAGEPFRSMRTAQGPHGEELLVIGGAARPVGRSEDTRDEVRAIDSWAALHFPRSQRVCWWAAQDYRSFSRLPYAGRLPRGGERIYVATGYNKWGMTNGVASAHAIAAEILGDRLEWSKQIDDHCIRIADARDAFGVNASVAGRLVSGWAAAELRSVASIDAPKEGEGIVARDGIEPVGIARVGGKTCRVSGVCTHLGGVLRWNGAEQTWDCPLHGSRFAADGSLLEGPAVHDLASPTNPDQHTNVQEE